MELGVGVNELKLEVFEFTPMVIWRFYELYLQSWLFELWLIIDEGLWSYPQYSKEDISEWYMKLWNKQRQKSLELLPLFEWWRSYICNHECFNEERE